LNKTKQSQGETFAESTRPLILTWVVIVISSCAVFFGNLRFGKSVLGVAYEDDFFYYAQAAHNLALHGRSSFDGIHLTNGYHPLWLLVLTAVTKIFGGEGMFHSATVFPFAIALEVVQLAIVIWISYFALRVCRLYCNVAMSGCIQLMITSFALLFVRGGMEVGLTLGFAFTILWFRLPPRFRWTAGTSFVYGLLASLMVLSRLDSVILVGLLFVFDLAPNAGRRRERVVNGLCFGAGMLPVLFYALVNEEVFQTVMPISGMAKQLRFHHIPSLHALHSFLPYLIHPASILLGPCVLATAGALVLLGMRRLYAAPGTEGVFWATLLFPIVYLFATVTLSDWMLWQWYLYGWLISGFLAAVLFVSQRREKSKVTTGADWLGFALALVFFVGYVVSTIAAVKPKNNFIYLTAVDISEFADQHPGVYAMGDRAGSVGYLMPYPVVQLEGLMMDKPYLDNIRLQRNLFDVLRQYNVRYYVSTWDTPDGQGCYSMKEPSKVGPDSPVMQGRICQEPVAVFSHGPFVSRIFELHGAVER